jgi:hypothetical protein
VGRLFEAADLRRQDAIEGRVHLAWQTAAFMAMAQSKRGLPSLDAVLKKKPRAQTTGEMKAVLLQLAQETGFPVRHGES